jgi:hypothetical protein
MGEEAVEEQPPAARAAAVEAKDPLVEVGRQVLGAD